MFPELTTPTGEEIAIPSNEEWLLALSSPGSRQEEALGILRTRLIKGLRSALAGRAIDPAVLEDAVQEALVKILDRLSSFGGRSRFETWAMTIAVRAVWTETRRRHWKNVSLDTVARSAVDSTSMQAAPLPGPEKQTERAALIALLHRTIARDLTAKQRTALLAELAGMPQEEIARRLGGNRNSLYKLVHDARKRLKARLEAGGYSKADLQSAFD